jgi:UDP-glucose 4-epimerase
MNFENVPVVVLGASGFIGRWVARCLSQQGAKVFLFVRDRDFAEKVFDRYNIEGEVIEQDLRKEAWTALYRKIRPSACFNLAGYGVDRAEHDQTIAREINVELIRRLADTVKEVRASNWSGLDIVHCGSALEYGETGGILSEQTTPRPTTLYGKSKLEGTNTLVDSCKRNAIKGVTARLFTVYGPGELPGRLLPDLIETAKTKKPLLLTAGTQKRDFTYVQDVAEGLLRLVFAAPAPGEIVNLATGDLTSVRHFAETAAAVLGIEPSRLIFGAIPVREEEMMHSNVSIERLRKLTSWSPSTAIQEGIRKTVDFETGKSNGT